LTDLKFQEPITLKQAQEILGCSHERAMLIVKTKGLVKSQQQYREGKTSRTGKIWILEAEDVRKLRIQHDEGMSWQALAKSGSYYSRDEIYGDRFRAMGKISPHAKNIY